MPSTKSAKQANKAATSLSSKTRKPAANAGTQRKAGPSHKEVLERIVNKVKRRYGQIQRQRKSEGLIDRPHGERYKDWKLQVAVGLKKNKPYYNGCMRLVRGVMEESGMDKSLPLKNQPPGMLAAVYNECARRNGWFLRFRKHWATHEFLKQSLANARKQLRLAPPGEPSELPVDQDSDSDEDVDDDEEDEDIDVNASDVTANLLTYTFSAGEPRAAMIDPSLGFDENGLPNGGEEDPEASDVEDDDDDDDDVDGEEFEIIDPPATSATSRRKSSDTQNSSATKSARIRPTATTTRSATASAKSAPKKAPPKNVPAKRAAADDSDNDIYTDAPTDDDTPPPAKKTRTSKAKAPASKKRTKKAVSPTPSQIEPTELEMLTRRPKKKMPKKRQPGAPQDPADSLPSPAYFDYRERAQARQQARTASASGSSK